MSDSEKFRITSRKLGIEPVVSAFTRGRVMVGEVACAVKGIAHPEDIRLYPKVIPGWSLNAHYHPLEGNPQITFA